MKREADKQHVHRSDFIISWHWRQLSVFFKFWQPQKFHPCCLQMMCVQLHQAVITSSHSVFEWEAADVASVSCKRELGLQKPWWWRCHSSLLRQRDSSRNGKLSIYLSATMMSRGSRTNDENHKQAEGDDYMHFFCITIVNSLIN